MISDGELRGPAQIEIASNTKIPRKIGTVIHNFPKILEDVKKCK